MLTQLRWSTARSGPVGESATDVTVTVRDVSPGLLTPPGSRLGSLCAAECLQRRPLRRQARGFLGPGGVGGLQRGVDLCAGQLDMGTHVRALRGCGENAVDTVGGGIKPMKVQIRDDLEVVKHDLLIRGWVCPACHLNQGERLWVLASPEKLVDLIDFVDFLRSRQLLLVGDASQLFGYRASLSGTESINRLRSLYG